MLVKENSPVKSSLLGNITTFRVTLVVVLVGVEVGTVSYMPARVGSGLVRAVVTPIHSPFIDSTSFRE